MSHLIANFVAPFHTIRTLLIHVIDTIRTIVRQIIAIILAVILSITLLVSSIILAVLLIVLPIVDSIGTVLRSRSFTRPRTFDGAFAYAGAFSGSFAHAWAVTWQLACLWRAILQEVGSSIAGAAPWSLSTRFGQVQKIIQLTLGGVSTISRPSRSAAGQSTC